MYNYIAMYPPNAGGDFMVKDRRYVCAAGSYLPQVPDFDAFVLEANGWTRAATTLKAGAPILGQMVRMVAPSGPASNLTLPQNGRNYSANPGASLDVPDFDAGQLEANGWTRLYIVVSTAKRPNAEMANRGLVVFDSDLSKQILCNGAAWIDPTNGAAV